MAEREAPIEAVIFDWGGTLTPWKTIDPAEEWATLARAAAAERHEEVTEALLRAADTVWSRSRDEHTSATLEEICTLAGVEFDHAHFEGYRAFWEHATLTDPDVLPLFSRLKVDGLRVGVLSNTIWSRAYHRELFQRDGVLDLVDGDVYSSEIHVVKPHAEAFLMACRAVGVEPQHAVYVGDRLFEDVHGPQQVGMRAIWVPHSDIPAEQRVEVDVTPDAEAHQLSDIVGIVDRWIAGH